MSGFFSQNSLNSQELSGEDDSLLSLSLGSATQLRGRVFAHGAVGRRIDPSWWTQ